MGQGIMATVDKNHDYVASLCEASAALRSENVQLRNERDEARAERDQLALRLTKITAELATTRKEKETLTNGLSSLIRGTEPLITAVLKRSLECTEDDQTSTAKRSRVDSPEPSQPCLLTSVVEMIPSQEEQAEKEYTEPEDDEDEENDPVQQWVDQQWVDPRERVHLESIIELNHPLVLEFRNLFLTPWSDNSPLEAKFLRLLNWVFRPHYNLEGMIQTFDQYACWTFGRRTGTSGPCPWARTLSIPFSSSTDHVGRLHVSDCSYCKLLERQLPGLCMWLCHADVDTGYPDRDHRGIMRKRNGSLKVADKNDWRTPSRLTENIRGKEVRWVVHLYN